MMKNLHTKKGTKKLQKLIHLDSTIGETDTENRKFDTENEVTLQSEKIEGEQPLFIPCEIAPHLQMKFTNKNCELID